MINNGINNDGNRTSNAKKPNDEFIAEAFTEELHHQGAPEGEQKENQAEAN